jgi:hypothetical protein
MIDNKNKNLMKNSIEMENNKIRFDRIIYTILSVMTAMVGYTIHHSIFWSIMDFLFTPLAWIKWLICQEVNLTIIKQTFQFFLN